MARIVAGMSRHRQNATSLTPRFCVWGSSKPGLRGLACIVWLGMILREMKAG
jgi:hypothetical protein